MKRQLVQIPAEQVRRIWEIREGRKDLTNFPISKIVHLLLQERIAEIFKEQEPEHKESPSAGKWYEYMRELIPTHIFAPIAIGVVRNSQEMIGYPFSRILVYTEGNKTVWGNYKEDIPRVGEFILAKFRDRTFARGHIEKHENWYKEMNERCENLLKKDPQDLSAGELFSTYSEFYEKLKRFHALSFDIDAIDIVLEQKMKEKLQQFLPRKTVKEVNETFNLITTPIEFSYVSQEKLDLQKAALFVQEDPALRQLLDY